LAVLVVGLGMAGSASAQRTLTFNAFFGPTQNVPITTENVNAPIAAPQTISNSFSLKNFFPSISRMNAKPVIGQSQFPTVGQQPGLDYLSAFHFRRGQF
jgi:hypothetical protein